MGAKNQSQQYENSVHKFEDMKIKQLEEPHILAKLGQPILAAPLAALGPYTRRGSTSNFDVYYDNNLGTNGQNLADAVLANCESDFAQLRIWFGGLNAGRFAVYIDPGSFGAYHANCAATDLHCAAFSGTNGALENMLNVAEADEVFMANQGRGWNCGASNGEGLSRVLAAERYPAALDGFASGASWLDSDRPDWVSKTEPTDGNYVSTGCATLFINYLRFHYGFSLDQIVQAGGFTLAQTFTKLVGSYYPFERFALFLNLRFPPGTPSGLLNDNPFPIQIQSLPLSGVIHLEGIGDYPFNNDNFVGTQGQSRRLEGFQIQFAPPVTNLGMRYMAHLQDVGDVQWVNSPMFIGTRGEGRRLEGFAIELTGSAASRYDVMYMAHLEGIGDTGFFQNGQFCGTRGQARRVEGILVHVGPKAQQIRAARGKRPMQGRGTQPRFSKQSKANLRKRR
jgi:Clostridial hydrophobic W